MKAMRIISKGSSREKATDRSSRPAKINTFCLTGTGNVPCNKIAMRSS